MSTSYDEVSHIYAPVSHKFLLGMVPNKLIKMTFPKQFDVFLPKNGIYQIIKNFLGFKKII